VNLDDIPAGSLCVVDTNVLLYAEQGVSAQAQRFIRRCSSGELKGVLPQTVWQELTHKLMLAEAMMRGLTSGGNPAARLASRPEAIRSLTLYRAKVTSLIDLGFGFEACLLTDLTERAFELQQRYGLLTNDAVVLAVALRLKADALISSDKSFREVNEPSLYFPTDLRLPSA
jgi:predicted nucleic acid-binding protein